MKTIQKLNSRQVAAIILTICGKISANQGPNCDYPLQGGVKDRMVLLNFDDWQDATIGVNVTNPQLVEDIVLGSGITGYLIQGKNNSNRPTSAFNKQAFAEVFTHLVNFKGFGIGPSDKIQYEKLVQGRFVAVLENNYKGSDGSPSFEIYGKDAGLIVPDGGLTRDPNSADTQGAYDITLQTDENNKEPHLPASLFKTNYATTKGIFESLFVE